jgi:uncharacterized protein involved in type VI secretion and phage assembly
MSFKPGGPKKDSQDNVGYGLQYGIVTQNKDPDNLNRIKVRLPWLDQGDTDQTHWAQLMTQMEGDKFGWYVLPDIDDVVAVMFMQGDITQPVIMGGVWSTKDTSPEPNEDGKNNFRGYRSRCGHRLILDDTKKTKVVLVDKTTKLMIGVGNFEKEGAGPNKSATFAPPQAAKTGISMSSMEGTFEITCKNGKLKVTAEKNITINATDTLTMKAGSDVKLSGSSAAKLTSSAASNYDASKVNIG